MAPSIAISNDTAPVAAVPAKAVQTANGSNGSNGNGTAALKASETVHEITDQTVLTAKYDVFKTAEFVTNTEARKFDCVKHIRPAQFPEALGALPFPQELRGLVAWTDAFVERLGWAALQEEKKTASQKIALSRADQENEKLTLRIRELETKLHGFVDDGHKLRAQIAQLTSRNKFLEGHTKRDHEQIEAFKETISEKQTEIWTLTQENEKLRASVKCLEQEVKKLINQHGIDEESRKALVEAFEKWQELDKVHDKEAEALIAKLDKESKENAAAASTAEKERKDALARLAKLEAENARLETLRAQLQELVKTIREQLKKIEGEFGISQGQKATLEALLRELKKKEESSQVEIQSLHQKLHDAKDSVEAAQKDVLAAKDHAKTHWETLQTIRVDGGWLRTEKKDDCDTLFFKDPVFCGRPATQPIKEISNPFN